MALGAGLLAYSLGQLEGVVLIDVLPMAIGVGLPGGRFKPILDRNTKLPAKKTYTIGTTRDDQPELEVTIFQGDSPRAQDNEYLGTLRLTGLPRGPRGSVQITITFELSNEALLKVSAREHRTGREIEATFSTRDTPQAVKEKLERLEAAPNGPAFPITGEHPLPGTAHVVVPASSRTRSGETTVPAGTPSAEAIAATSSGGGFLGWLKRLFAGK